MGHFVLAEYDIYRRKKDDDPKYSIAFRIRDANNKLISTLKLSKTNLTQILILMIDRLKIEEILMELEHILKHQEEPEALFFNPENYFFDIIEDLPSLNNECLNLKRLEIYKEKGKIVINFVGNVYFTKYDRNWGSHVNESSSFKLSLRQFKFLLNNGEEILNYFRRGESFVNTDATIDFRQENFVDVAPRFCSPIL